MSYQVLARKYRPANFQEMEGQEHVLRALINALEQNRLHHAYLFAGTRGVGKTSIARILAKCLNCEAGVTATPCGECTSCMEIAQGRSIDLIEVDAASRTGVDDMRELLDNVQYMPMSSRFKVYLIDEIHMLSKSSFNAMLKTLEEPPEHVKFLFATTDPKKLPVTVLSRCLQFNLKNLSPERIVSYLQQILPKEGVNFEENALWQLGRAADGSMRDALSLTDQAISFGNNTLTDDAVKTMLGSIDQREVYELLDALIEKDGARLLEKVRSLAQFAPDFSALLDEFLGVLHRIAIAQVVPDGIDNSQGDRELVIGVANAMPKEDVQLFYQIGLIGKRDIQMAPDPRSGFEMVLLRMFAFTPGQGESSGSTGSGGEPTKSSPIAGLLSTINGKTSSSAEPVVSTESNSTTLRESEPEPKTQEAQQKRNPARTLLDVIDKKSEPVEDGLRGMDKPATSNAAVEPKAVEPPSIEKTVAEIPVVESTKPEVEVVENESSDSDAPISDDPIVLKDWTQTLTQLGLSGVTQTLAANCTLQRVEGNRCFLLLNEHHASLWNKTHESRISRALTEHHGQKVSVGIEVGTTDTETPAQADSRQQQERQAQAVVAIENDEHIQELIRNFNGTLDRDSIAPMQPGEQ
jgi:DNA polymerase III subunit gamma/tau